MSWSLWYRETPPAPPLCQCLPAGLLGYREHKLKELEEAWRDRLELGTDIEPVDFDLAFKLIEG